MEFLGRLRIGSRERSEVRVRGHGWCPFVSGKKMSMKIRNLRAGGSRL